MMPADIGAILPVIRAVDSLFQAIPIGTKMDYS